MTDTRVMARDEPRRDSATLLRRLLLSGTVVDLETAILHEEIAKSDLQLYGVDWSQLEDEPGDAPLAEAFARHGAVVPPTDTP